MPSPPVTTVSTVCFTPAQEGLLRSKARLPFHKIDAFYPGCIDQIDMGISTRAVADSPNGRLMSTATLK